jgi:hypothetical protein
MKKKFQQKKSKQTVDDLHYLACFNFLSGLPTGLKCSAMFSLYFASTLL